jgi:hypothetical protein
MPSSGRVIVEYACTSCSRRPGRAHWARARRHQLSLANVERRDPLNGLFIVL